MKLDFNSTSFSHPKSGTLSLSNPDDSIREFWIEHTRRCRQIAEDMGKAQGDPCIMNIWIHDGSKDSTLNRYLYRELLKDMDELIPLRDPAYPMKHAWHLFVVRVDVDKAGITRDQFMTELKQRNIGTGLHFRCTHLQKYYREQLGCQPGTLPNTEWNSDRIVSLPLFPDMTEKDQDDVLAAMKDIFARHGH